MNIGRILRQQQEQQEPEEQSWLNRPADGVVMAFVGGCLFGLAAIHLLIGF